MKDFHTQYNAQVNHLMGSLVQLDNLANHVYQQRLNKGKEQAISKELQGYLQMLEEGRKWSLLEARFVKDYCRLQGLSQESGLLLTT